jgi:hypothetical protein
MSAHFHARSAGERARNWGRSRTQAVTRGSAEIAVELRKRLLTCRSAFWPGPIPAGQEAEGDRRRALGHRGRHQELPSPDLGRGRRTVLLLLVPHGRRRRVLQALRCHRSRLVRSHGNGPRRTNGPSTADHREVDVRAYLVSLDKEVHAELASFCELARTAGTPEVRCLARTIKRWEPQVLSYFTTWRTNARSEAQNLTTEKLRRVAHGLRNFEHYRLRLLLHSGAQWNTRPTARIRGRHPLQLVA